MAGPARLTDPAATTVHRNHPGECRIGVVTAQPGTEIVEDQHLIGGPAAAGAMPLRHRHWEGINVPADHQTRAAPR